MEWMRWLMPWQRRWRCRMTIDAKWASADGGSWRRNILGMQSAMQWLKDTMPSSKREARTFSPSAEVEMCRVLDCASRDHETRCICHAALPLETARRRMGMSAFANGCGGRHTSPRRSDLLSRQTQRDTKAGLKPDTKRHEKSRVLPPFREISCAAKAAFVSCGRRAPKGAAVAARLARRRLRPGRGDTAVRCRMATRRSQAFVVARSTRRNVSAATFSTLGVDETAISLAECTQQANRPMFSWV